MRHQKWSTRLRVVSGAHLLVVLLVVACGSDVDGRVRGGAPGNTCPESLPSEPPCNPALADGPWAGAHRSSYAQGSSPLEGPRRGQRLDKQHVYVTGVPVVLGFTGQYADGGRAVWSSPVSSLATVVKLDAETLEILDEYVPREREPDAPPAPLGVSGAYSLVDVDDHFIVARGRAVEVFADEVPGDRRSRIGLVTRFTLPDALLCGAGDTIVGITMTYDGRIAVATARGVVATLPRQPAQMLPENVVAYAINDAASCDGGAATLEETSNSIAADESGGIYVVTSAAMYRFDWDGAALSLGWRAAYQAGSGQVGVRLGAGSGSTPTLMGTAPTDDRFVVFTDGQELMHLVLMWRDEVPADWEPIAEGRDRRIACEIPVTFGDDDATASLSEQSVLVRGYASIVVNNLLADPDAFAGQLPILQNLNSALAGGDPAQAPYGVERIDWNPVTRECEVVWANPAPSIPNAIPTMSERTGLIYAHGQRDGVWGLEAIDFDTGESAFFEPAPDQECATVLDYLPFLERAASREVIERLPHSCENSAYSAAEIGPDGSLYQGTWSGISRYRPR
ncbi:MAG: hypothetical protein IPL19_12885 [Sandaracinaceae bacterium]|jgi:hypothetical protein|nr:hypothetical protein [Sandaracinaceae bacterium]